MDEVDELVQAARSGLEDVSDPAKAVRMRRYMKSAMDFRGVPKPERARLARRVFGEHPLPDRESFVAAVRELWRNAAFREERYLAIDLTGHRAYARWQDHTLVPLYEEMIVTGAWWDYVDEIAIRRIGPIRRADPGRVTPLMRRWARDADKWRRRSAVICQVGSKEDTDRELLADVIEANQTDPDFFLRKGIGWALRDFSRTAPDWVRAFVDAHPALSPLSVREALKHLGG